MRATFSAHDAIREMWHARKDVPGPRRIRPVEWGIEAVTLGTKPAVRSAGNSQTPKASTPIAELSLIGLGRW